MSEEVTPRRRRGTVASVLAVLVATAGVINNYEKIENFLCQRVLECSPAVLDARVIQVGYGNDSLKTELEIHYRGAFTVRQIAMVRWLPDGARDPDGCTGWCGINVPVGTPSYLKENLVSDDDKYIQRTITVQITPASLFSIGLPATGELSRFRTAGNESTTVIPVAIQSTIFDNRREMEIRSRYMAGYVAIRCGDCQPDVVFQNALDSTRRLNLLNVSMETFQKFVELLRGVSAGG